MSSTSDPGPHQRGKNKYETANRYESDEPATDTATATNGGVPTRVQLPAPRRSDEWRPRAAPIAPLYTPEVGIDFFSRRRALKLAEGYTAATRVAGAATGFQQSLQRLEQARQDLELASERRAHIPLQAERERLTLGQEIVKARIGLQAIIEEETQQQIDRKRRRDLDSADFELAKKRREAEALEAVARLKAAEAQLAWAEKVGTRRGEAELRKADEEVFRSEAAAETERRNRDDARRKRRQTEGAGGPEMPETLRKHLVTEQAVKESHGHVEQQVREIRMRATAENRDLTSEETEQIDSLESAGAAAEGAIRRGEASDFEA